MYKTISKTYAVVDVLHLSDHYLVHLAQWCNYSHSKFKHMIIYEAKIWLWVRERNEKETRLNSVSHPDTKFCCFAVEKELSAKESRADSTTGTDDTA